MCRLFGMSGVPRRVEATFWLLEAPDSLAMQSRREPDGTGLGIFEDGQARVMKQAIAAYEDRAFAEEARSVRSTTFIAHVRFASTGGLDTKNTHPFALQNRLFAHNGVIGDLERLERELGSYRQLVGGDTDSERFFALVTKATDDHARRRGRRDRRGRRVGRRQPAALCPEPDPDDRRRPVGAALPGHARAVGARPRAGRPARLAPPRAGELPPAGCACAPATSPQAPAVVLASERMDENPGWRLLDPGELLHVDARRGAFAAGSCSRTRPPIR